MSEASSTQKAPKPANATKVMIVDDSRVIRKIISGYFDDERYINVVAEAENGQEAIDRLNDHQIEVVILDVNMPIMNGLAALPKLLGKNKNLKIIMASTLTSENANITLEALNLGAAECLLKPRNVEELSGESGFRADLVRKVKVLGDAFRKSLALQTKLADKPQAVEKRDFSLRPKSFLGMPHVIAISSSTGGPMALNAVLADIKDKINLPIFITQHMPPGFTASLAGHLEKVSGVPAAEGCDGEVVEPGRIYVAPGDYHMLFEKNASGAVCIKLDKGPPENFCRPAADPMLRSLADVYGEKILSVVLTGMGKDGFEGCKVLVEKNAEIIAQDEKTSVVWGMPEAVAMGGLCNHVLPIDKIGPYIKKRSVSAAILQESEI